MPCVPPIVVQITKDPQVTAQDLSTVDTFYSSAAPISVELGQEFLRKFPGKKLRNGVQWTASYLFLRLIVRPISCYMYFVTSISYAYGRFVVADRLWHDGDDVTDLWYS